MFSKILVANRGEIAVRIIRACKEMGIETVAIYSEADEESLHVMLADEKYLVGKASASESYLNIKKIIKAALDTGAQAIHPGYGFLSESSEFAAACSENNIVFIGPDADCMNRISNKASLKEIINDTELSTIPGTQGLSNEQEVVEAAKKVGYPLMIKASHGGGGRGMRLVESEEMLVSQYYQAAAESLAAFGKDEVYLERYIYPARHIEVQILADNHGNVVCLGDRDCSVQVDHRKLIEETPSPGMNSERRDVLMKQVADAVKKLDYTGAGTLEFLMDSDGNCWFMEMNTRIQVEHCVTEMLTRIDLIKWQIRIAADLPLSFTQESVKFEGSSIECRINAMSTGRIGYLHVPGGAFVRFDTFLKTGDLITPFYDSLLGKVVVYGVTREDALRKMNAALCELIITGVETNIMDQLNILSNEDFRSGDYNLAIWESR